MVAMPISPEVLPLIAWSNHTPSTNRDVLDHAQQRRVGRHQPQPGFVLAQPVEAAVQRRSGNQR